MNDKWKSIVSLLLVIHIFCVLVSLASNISPSRLQEKLRRVLAVYTLPLNLYLDFAPFELSQGTEVDGLWQIQYRTETDPANRWTTANATNATYSEAAQRERRLARLAGLMALTGRDDETASLVSGFIQNSRSARTGTITQVRILRQPLRTLDELELARIEQAELTPEPPRLVYQARVVTLDGGAISLVKIDASGRAAEAIQRAAEAIQDASK